MCTGALQKWLSLIDVQATTEGRKLAFAWTTCDYSQKLQPKWKTRNQIPVQGSVLDENVPGTRSKKSEHLLQVGK